MVYELKNSLNGEKAPYKTTVEFIEEGDNLIINFACENSTYFCPHTGKYNAFHCLGDVCEVFIGNDKNKEVYYEMQISPNNDVFLGKITNLKGNAFEQGFFDSGFYIDYVKDSFIKSKVIKTDNGYNVMIKFNKNDVLTGDGETFVNAFRIETDGEKAYKHLMALSPTFAEVFHIKSSFVNLDKYVKRC